MAFRSEATHTVEDRLAALRAHLAPRGAAGAAMLATVGEIVAASDLARTDELRQAHMADLTGTGPNQGRASPYKYLDIVFWTFAKLEAAQAIGLDRAARPLRILDIGAGACHFARGFPNAAEAEHGPYALTTAPVDARFSARQVETQVAFTSETDSRVGVIRLDVRAGGRR